MTETSTIRGAAGCGTEEISQFQFPDHPGGLIDDRLRHFRHARPPVNEDDRYFSHPETEHPGHVICLDLKGVPVGTEGIEVDGFKDDTFVAFETARRVVDRHARDDPRIQIRKVAQEEPAYRPIDDVDAGNVPRPDDQVEVLHPVE